MTNDQTTRIAMFSGPRNISTTMMRAFENRPDTVVYDEPFYACYLRASGAPHPMREEVLASQPAEWQDVIDQLNTPLPGDAEISFQKHIAFHFAGGAPLDWLKGARVFHLIRNPRAMIASYSNKYDDIAPIVESLKIQRRIYENTPGAQAPSPIVDAADLLKNPTGVLRALCAELDIPFSDKMVAWPAGPRPSDGVWATHWYDAVVASTGFRPYVEKDINLSPALEAIAAQCLPDYAFFHRRRLIAAQQ